MRLRRKSLAILYYLACEGSTRRSVLADLLWERVDSGLNLRVELHGLKNKFATRGADAFTDRQDPLELPRSVHVDDQGQPALVPLEGLDDLSPQFQDWLEQQRARLQGNRATGFRRGDLVESVASKIRLPYLLVVSGQPDSGQRDFAEAVAAKLGLRLSLQCNGGESASACLLEEADDDNTTLVDTMLREKNRLWIVERSSFREDSEFLLRLRARFPADRVSYLELPPLGWRELRAELGDSLPFSQAAELFTFTGGHSGFVREMLSLNRPPRAAAIVPQRVRAAYQLEARNLSEEARFALERASVHPGVLGDAVLSALDITPHLPELERRNWLTYDEGWRFCHAFVRNVVYHTLPVGRRTLFHRRAADALLLAGDKIAAAYHQGSFGADVDWHSLVTETGSWARRVTGERAGLKLAASGVGKPLGLGEELELLETDVFGDRVEVDAGTVLICRDPLRGESLRGEHGGVEWQLPTGGEILHLHGSMFVDNQLGIGLTGAAAPLQLQFLGVEPRTVVFAPVENPQVLSDGTQLIPMAATIDHYFRYHGHRLVRVTSAAETAIIELTASVFKSGSRRHVAPVYDLRFAAAEPGGLDDPSALDLMEALTGRVVGTSGFLDSRRS